MRDTIRRDQFNMCRRRMSDCDSHWRWNNWVNGNLQPPTAIFVGFPSVSSTSWLSQQEENALLSLTQAIAPIATYSCASKTAAPAPQPCVDQSAGCFDVANQRHGAWTAPTEPYASHHAYHEHSAPVKFSAPSAFDLRPTFYQQQSLGRCWRPSNRPKTQYEKGSSPSRKAFWMAYRCYSNVTRDSMRTKWN